MKIKKKKIDKRKLEQNQNITKQYAVSYAMLAYDYMHPNLDASEFGYAMVELMRAIKPRFAVKEADKLLYRLNSKPNKNRKGKRK